MTLHQAPRQRILATMGEGACYVLSIVHVAEEVADHYIDAFAQFMWAQGQMVVKDRAAVPMIDETCYVNGPAEFMAALTGKQVVFRKEAANYQCQPGEHEILRFERKETVTGKTIVHGHFVVGDGQGGVLWDSMGESMTVRLGKLVSKRIFRFL